MPAVGSVCGVNDREHSDSAVDFIRAAPTTLCHVLYGLKNNNCISTACSDSSYIISRTKGDAYGLNEEKVKHSLRL